MKIPKNIHVVSWGEQRGALHEGGTRASTCSIPRRKPSVPDDQSFATLKYCRFGSCGLEPIS